MQIKEFLRSDCGRRTSKSLPNYQYLSFPQCHWYFCLYWLNIVAKRGCCGLASNLPKWGWEWLEICICYLFLALFDSSIYAGIYTYYPRNDASKPIQLIPLYTVHYVKLMVNYLPALLSRANPKKIRSKQLNEGRVGNALHWLLEVGWSSQFICIWIQWGWCPAVLFRETFLCNKVLENVRWKMKDI